MPHNIPPTPLTEKPWYGVEIARVESSVEVEKLFYALEKSPPGLTLTTHGVRPGSGGTLFSIGISTDDAMRAEVVFLEKVSAKEMIAWLKGYGTATHYAL